MSDTNKVAKYVGTVQLHVEGKNHKKEDKGFVYEMWVYGQERTNY